MKWESIKSLFAPFVVIAYTVSFDRLRFPLWLFEVGPQCVIVSQLAAAAFRSTNHDSVWIEAKPNVCLRGWDIMSTLTQMAYIAGTYNVICMSLQDTTVDFSHTKVAGVQFPEWSDLRSCCVSSDHFVIAVYICVELCV